MCQIIKVNRRGQYTRQQLLQEQSTKNSWSDERPDTLSMLYTLTLSVKDILNLRPVFFICLFVHITLSRNMSSFCSSVHIWFCWWTGVWQSDDAHNAQPIGHAGPPSGLANLMIYVNTKPVASYLIHPTRAAPQSLVCVGFWSERGSQICWLGLIRHRQGLWLKRK